MDQSDRQPASSNPLVVELRRLRVLQHHQLRIKHHFRVVGRSERRKKKRVPPGDHRVGSAFDAPRSFQGWYQSGLLQRSKSSRLPGRWLPKFRLQQCCQWLKEFLHLPPLLSFPHFFSSLSFPFPALPLAWMAIQVPFYEKFRYITHEHRGLNQKGGCSGYFVSFLVVFHLCLHQQNK